MLVSKTDFQSSDVVLEEQRDGSIVRMSSAANDAGLWNVAIGQDRVEERPERRRVQPVAAKHLDVSLHEKILLQSFHSSEFSQFSFLKN